MFNISQYLEKFNSILTDSRVLKGYVQEVIQDICDIKIDPTHIEIRSGVVYISEKPIIKNEIFLKKEKILNRLKEKNIIKIQ